MKTVLSYFPAAARWLTAGLLLVSLLSRADFPVENLPRTVRQPDGTELHLFVSGDTYYHWLHDADNYTIVQDERGYFVYATVREEELVPTGLIVGKVNPATNGLRPGLNHSERYVEQLRNRRGANRQYPSFVGAMREAHEATSNARFGGATMNPLVLFVRFKGEAEFTDLKADYTGLFNTDAVSLKNYYLWNSYSTLTMTSTIVGGTATTIASYQDANSRSYYQPRTAANPNGYDKTDTVPTSTGNISYREQKLWQNAINSLKSKVSAGLDLDINNDGYVDMIYFVVSGGAGDWADLLWPHMGYLGSNSIKINGKTPSPFMCVFKDWHDVGLLCHETGHVLGAPDFYRYSNKSIAPVYNWELMSNQTNPPQSMTAYTKWKYMGFISNIPEITQTGYYTLSPLGDHPSAYKIRSTKANEFFVLEYRKKTASSFESQIPGSGLLIYRVNPTIWGNGSSGKTKNTNYPDELYAYRPGGTDTATTGDLSKAFFTSDAGRDQFGDHTSPSAFMSDLTAGRLNISNIGSAGNTIGFYYKQTCMSAGASLSVTYVTSFFLPKLTEAVTTITASDKVNVASGQSVTFRAGKVLLKKGFHAAKGANFYAVRSNCVYQAIPTVARIMASAEIQVDEGKVLEEPSDGDLFSLYPNPADQLVNVAFKEGIQAEESATVEIFNASGAKVFQLAVDEPMEKLVIDLKHQPSGLYLLRVTSGKESSTKRLLIK